MAEFNRMMVEVATLNFGEILMHSEYAKAGQLDGHKYGLRYAGYRFISA